MTEHWADFADCDDSPVDLQPTLVLLGKTAINPDMPMSILGDRGSICPLLALSAGQRGVGPVIAIVRLD